MLQVIRGELLANRTAAAVAAYGPVTRREVSLYRRSVVRLLLGNINDDLPQVQQLGASPFWPQKLV